MCRSRCRPQSNISEMVASFVRGPIWTDERYSFHRSSHWEHFGYRSVDHPGIAVFMCRDEVHPALYISRPSAGQGHWLRGSCSGNNRFGFFLSGDCWRSYAVHPVNWLHIPMTGRSQSSTIPPAWVEGVNNESIPPLIAQEPLALASVLDNDDSYASLLGALFAAKPDQMTAGASLNFPEHPLGKGGSTSIANGERRDEVPATSDDSAFVFLGPFP